MGRHLSLTTAAAAALLALGVGACGQTTKDSSSNFKGEQQVVAKAVERLQEDGRKRDAGAICTDLLVPALVKQIETASKRSCKSVLGDALNDTDSFELQVKSVDITGTTARAQVASESGKDQRTDTLTLEKVGGAWKVAALSALS